MMRRDRVKDRQPGYTQTSEGRIAHIRYQFGAHIIDAPVKVWPRLGNESLPHPAKTDDGRYLHVLPGGYTIPGEYAR